MFLYSLLKQLPVKSFLLVSNPVSSFIKRNVCSTILLVCKNQPPMDSNLTFLNDLNRGTH